MAVQKLNIPIVMGENIKNHKKAAINKGIIIRFILYQECNSKQ